MKALLSIKPEYVERILSGEKTFEFRRKVFKRDDVDTLVIYASSPVQRVVAQAKITRILSDTPESIWQFTHEFGGINREAYFHYFHDTTLAHAIELADVDCFDEPLPLREYAPNLTVPPQSFAYLD
ncbi:ASCH domain-containing protein [Alloscardovia theropitheci]|uniref:ASCH domain-containing protein n=1 Tax=Alloscardovia theropitheci TaxID=2496842 RepID=A0A4R0QPH0_9BIFI|nr:ASCH domain-containing protein [Alloscardovia theropitheci]TCD54124.1 ASCH domain-containing protein [Alloscardovia theropitheci]